MKTYTLPIGYGCRAETWEFGGMGECLFHVGHVSYGFDAQDEHGGIQLTINLLAARQERLYGCLYPPGGFQPTTPRSAE